MCGGSRERNQTHTRQEPLLPRVIREWPACQSNVLSSSFCDTNKKMQRDYVMMSGAREALRCQHSLPRPVTVWLTL